jgi:ELP3 family radical SAM enzyme/protein acetyltransferase
MADIESIVKPRVENYNLEAYKEFMRKYMEKFADAPEQEIQKEFDKFKMKMSRVYRITFAHTGILYAYRVMCAEQEFIFDQKHGNIFKKKAMRSQSGVMVLTIFTSDKPFGQKFTCDNDCYYCPNEPGQPRSYLMKEPGVSRANRYEFDSIRQVRGRATDYIQMGLQVDKIELLILGGTVSSYPKEYIVEFIRDAYYGLNTFFTGEREKLSLDEERRINESNKMCRIIGVTLETRPDRINPKELIWFRSMGVTRVQIGVQHIDDRVLYRVNRGCKTSHTINAIRLLKNCGFKVDIHIMLDLPKPLNDGVDNKKEQFEIDDIDQSVNMVELDRWMLNEIKTNQLLKADQYKLYPCQTTTFTRILDEYNRKVYEPYGGDANKLTEVIIEFLDGLGPDWRGNRIIRDIPVSVYVKAGVTVANLRQVIDDEIRKRGIKCMDMRFREIKLAKIDPTCAVLKERTFMGSDGIDHFLSFESEDEAKLFGFLRLRFSELAGKHKTLSGSTITVFPELVNCALIRELHVYGKMVSISPGNTDAQHVGLGTKLLNRAFEVAKE